MEAIVLKDFMVSSSDEFALKKGTVVKVFSVKQEEEDWYEAEQDGKIGVVPKTHIEITPHEHHDTITREAIALHDFTASAPDELSFKKGSKLTVFKVNQDRDWYKAKQDGKRGNVPKNYINLEPLEYCSCFTPKAREAIALHDFTASAPDELSFKKGSKLQILKQDTFSYQIELDGREGIIPNNCVKLQPPEWFKGLISIVEAEKMLEKQKKDGQFLIRESESNAGDFVLSVRFNNAIQHFKILKDGAGKYFLWVVKYNSLNQLVDYHRTASVSRDEIIHLKDMDE